VHNQTALLLLRLQPVATLKVNQHVGRPPAGGATSVMPPLGLQQDLQGVTHGSYV
jgi:hypothetical protein